MTGQGGRQPQVSEAPKADMEAEDMGTGKSGYIQPNSASHLCLLLESAAGRELRTREVKGRLGLRSQPAGQDADGVQEVRPQGCGANTGPVNQELGRPGDWKN